MATALQRDRAESFPAPHEPACAAARLSFADSSPPDRWGGLIGSLSAAAASALTHGVLLAVFAVVSLRERPLPDTIHVRALPAEIDVELEELLTQNVESEAMPVERPEFQALEPVAGDASNVADLGGALDAPQVAELTFEASATGLIDAGLRRALLDGRGGPAVGTGRGAPREASFARLLVHAERFGLEVVIAMDTTGSMGGEIETVKKKAVEIGGSLLNKVPQTRLSIVSYKDHGDDYVAKGLPLTNDLSEVQNFLQGIKAGGGGDPPEAVEAGLQWAIENNQFRPEARKIILVFGDQPPHDKDLRKCLMLASEFHHVHGGVVSTITCRKRAPIPQFYEIARVGGGEAFLLKDSRRIMEELLVLVFGNQHRKDVEEFFQLETFGN